MGEIEVLVIPKNVTWSVVWQSVIVAWFPLFGEIVIHINKNLNP